MDIEKEINSILFEMGKEIKVHRIDGDNTILEIDYQKHTIQLMRMFMKYLNEES